MSRRTHSKSRYGCDHCRRRRVKCDEQGPPCTNCILRQLSDCKYSRVLPQNLIAKARCGISDPVEAQFGYTQALNGITPTTSTTPLGPPTVDKLELMHQFSTETYKSLCVSDSEKRTWQILVPRLALKHRFLMNSILALASLHIATTREPSDALAYIDAGLDYHSSSLEPFRILIDNITPDNCDAAFAQAVVTTAISLALPQLTAARENVSRMTDNILTVFELLQGVKRILSIGQPWINLKLFSQGMFWKDELGDLDTDTEAALNQLVILNEQISIDSEPSYSRINKEVINHLRHCFMKFSCCPDPAPVLAWLAAVDKEFINNLRRQEPFSLLILAHWGILLKELDGQRWWARGSGRVLVLELMEELKSEDLSWEGSLGWVIRKMSFKDEEQTVEHPTVTND